MPRPRLIVCDEPAAALASSTQARVPDSFVALRQRAAVARHVSHRVSVRSHRDAHGTGPAGEIASPP
ncbi:hypothetical protein [Streptomyces himalayensis]|uniref:Uncharacterized protein n=1 Tax=Streptomyces himalayensis subsp. himalayensis TaxID=2756131 RepID=A0A7W0DVZ7_9ACTN|nr:hypothetical protein [Streptomyces himalayensis]MBA2951960.1 hypothetical protein [Streptomyces himalayensis subsp. himalayensis]